MFLCSSEIESVPCPGWTHTATVENFINTGIDGCSGGITIQGPNVVYRHRMGKVETDGAKWATGLSAGKHIFTIIWSHSLRDTQSTVGVGTSSAPLHSKSHVSLIGGNKESWGLDLGRYFAIHNNKMISRMPRNKRIPDKFYMFVDCDSATLGFGDDVGYWGSDINLDRNKYPVYPMLGMSFPRAMVNLYYKGSEVKVGQMPPPPVAMVTTQVVVPPSALQASNLPPSLPGPY